MFAQKYTYNLILNSNKKGMKREMKYDKEEIKKRAQYCLNCKNKPCKEGCPLENDIPSFIEKIKNQDYEGAFNVLLEKTIFSPICGRICPHKKQCEGSCVRGIKGESVSIGELEAFIGDLAIENDWYSKIKIVEDKKNKKVAIVGAGPSGIMAAYELARKGVDVTIFEKHEKIGGILTYGIPDFRLDKKYVDVLERILSNLDVDIKCNYKFNGQSDLEELKKKFDAILLSFGANVSSKMGIEGEDLIGVYGGNELLETLEFPDCNNKNIAVIGGGNVAMDISRTLNKLGAKKVTVIYRRSRKEMPAEQKEILEAEQEGVEFLFQNNILKIFGDENKKVNKVECIKTELIQKEGEKRAVPVNIENSNYYLDIDYVVMAVGSKVDENIVNDLELEKTKWKNIKVDENYKTSDEKVFSCGDLAGMKSTVAWAAKSGKDVADKIEEYLKI